MATDLKWRTGFDWGSVFLLIVSCLIGIFVTGILRWSALAVLLLVVLFMVAQYRKWNGAGWPSLHWRGMLLYASLAGLEAGRAREEGRDLDRESICRTFALKMCGPGKEAEVDAMIAALREERGSYLVSLFREQRRQLTLSSDQDAELERRLDSLAEIELGPKLVICNVIENAYGSPEAARYVLALLQSRAT